MTKLVSNIEIDSLVLERQRDENTENILNSLVISSAVNLSSDNAILDNINLRIVVSLTKQSAAVVDFITQRYNEFDSLNLEGVTSHEYNNFLKQSIMSEEEYLKSSSPFSPVSTDMEARNLIITNRVSIFGDGAAVAKDLIIYDIPMSEAVANLKNRMAMLDLIRIDLPTTTQDLEQLSVYAFAYDTIVPNFLKDDPEDNFTINTGTSIISALTPLGDKVLYLSPSKEEPFVGMQQENVEASPDADKLRTIEELPSDIAVKRYTNIAEKAEELFTTYQKDKNYELNKVLKRDNFFSDFWLSRDTEDNHRFVFAFDVQSYLAKNGLFPFVYKNDELARILIAGGESISPDTPSSVVSVEVFRKHFDKGPNEFFATTPVKDVKNVSISLPSDLDSIKISFFEGYDDFGTPDDANNQINGTYQYSAKCTVADNSPEMMRKLINTIYGLKRSTKLIYDYLVGNKEVFDTRTGLLSQDIKSISANIDGENINVADRLLTTAQTYEVFLSALSPAGQDLELQRYYENQFEINGGRISPQVIKDLENLLDLGIHFVFSKLEKFYPQDPLGRQQDSQKNTFAHNASRSNRLNLSVVEHTFGETYEKGKTDGYGLDYIFGEQDQQDSLSNINLEQYEQRRVEEFKKYFSAGKGGSEIIPGGSYENPSYAYMTAKTIRTPGREIINQTKYASEDAAVVEYDYDRYGQLFADIVDLNHQIKDLGLFYPSLFRKTTAQNINNKIYSSVRTLLEEKFGVSINEVVIPQFSSPQIIKDGTRSTIYNLRDRENCGPNAGLPLLQSVIGGENTQDTTTQSYLDSAGTKIKDEDSERSKGAIDSEAQKQDRKERAIKLPFAILGELTLDKLIHNLSTTEKDVFNSLTALRQALNISKSDIEAAIEGSNVSQMPNQLKSMLVFSTTDGVSSLGASDGSDGFDACRPRIRDADDDTSVGDLVSFFNNQEEIPPYPQTEDPMKIYAKFLAFWMNYRQVAVVEYLDGFSSLKPTDGNTELTDQKLKLANWSKMNASTAQSLLDRGGSILCRARLMTTEDYLELLSGANLSEQQRKSIIEYFESKELLNLPTYNQYFYIQSEAAEVVTEEPQMMEEQQQEQVFVVGY